MVLDGGVRHLSDKETAEYAEKLKDGKVLLTTRNGIFQARFYAGNRRYIYKSLKTRDLEVALERAVRTTSLSSAKNKFYQRSRNAFLT